MSTSQFTILTEQNKLRKFADDWRQNRATHIQLEMAEIKNEIYEYWARTLAEINQHLCHMKTRLLQLVIKALSSISYIIHKTIHNQHYLRYIGHIRLTHSHLQVSSSSYSPTACETCQSYPVVITDHASFQCKKYVRRLLKHNLKNINFSSLLFSYLLPAYV